MVFLLLQPANQVARSGHFAKDVTELSDGVEAFSTLSDSALKQLVWFFHFIAT
jgi:hypothetical protein